VGEWWQGRAGRLGRLFDAMLWPAEQSYAAAVWLRNRGYDRGILTSAAPAIHVLSVGNLTVGGAGKTPIAAWAASYLARAGQRPAVVLRGYGEDEVLVHRELNPNIPVFVAPRRVQGVRAAREAGCTVAIVDDGFQHRKLRRDLDILLIAAESWTERPVRLLPRGPWREPTRSAGRADLVVVTRKSATVARAETVRDELRTIVHPAPVVRCDLLPAGLVDIRSGLEIEPQSLSDRKVLGVAGLAEPDSFAAQLAKLGLDVELATYPDHHRFTAADAGAVVGRAAGRPLIMTLKDAVKLRSLLSADVHAYMLLQRAHPEPEFEHVLDVLSLRTRRGAS
jgi:tetraacyldisaccharide 4'-kinase